MYSQLRIVIEHHVPGALSAVCIRYSSDPHSRASSYCREMWAGSGRWLLFTRSVMPDSLRPHGVQHARPPCPLPSPRACSNSCPLSQWCSSSVVSISTCVQFFSASRCFLMIGSLHEVAKVLELQLQHQSFQWIFRIDFLKDWLVWSCSPRDSQESSPAPKFKSINSSVFNFLCSTTLISVHDYWENHTFDYTDLFR